MKKLLIVLLLFCFKTSFSQNVIRYSDIKLEQAADYRVADTITLNAAAYLLSTPFDKNNIDRLSALQFVIKWMTGTPDYPFGLDNTAIKIMKGNDDLMGLYMAAMAKYALENKSSATDGKLVKLNAVKSILAYCENTGNNMKMTKQLQKLSEANKKGELEQAL